MFSYSYISYFCILVSFLFFSDTLVADDVVVVVVIIVVVVVAFVVGFFNLPTSFYRLLSVYFWKNFCLQSRHSYMLYV